MQEVASAPDAGDVAPVQAGPQPEPGAPDARALGGLLGRAQEGVVGLWSQAGSEARALRQRADSELQRVWGRLVVLAGLPSEDTDRLWAELRDGLMQRRERLNGQLDELGRLASGFKRLSARTELERLRKRLAALDFRLRSLERRRGEQAAESPPEATG